MSSKLLGKWIGAGCAVALLLCVGWPAAAADDDVATLKREMESMRKQYDAELKKMQQLYEKRLDSLEHRVEAAESQAKTATEAAQQAPSAAAPVASTAAAAPPAEAGKETQSAAAFNPAIGAVLNGTAMASNHNPNTWRVPGVALGSDAKPPPRGLGLGESEINFQANADQLVFANLTVAFERDNTVGVEEGFIQPTSLPWGFTLKGGRFFSGVGYLNEQHSHVWDFVDQPLPYMAFLNTQYDDDGAQLRWLAPTPMFLEFGAELLRGDVFPAGGSANHNAGIGAWSAFVHAGDDIGTSASYSVGLSHLWTKAKNRTTAGQYGTDSFTGTDDTFILDGVYKWAPNGNFVDTYLKLQGEVFLHKSAGLFYPATAPALGLNYTSFPGEGFYVQGVYQFMPQWRFGLRYDQLHVPSLGPLYAGTTLDNLNATARRYTAMVDWSPSEFSRFRIQYNNDHSRPETDNQFIFQYIVSIGAHGAHQY
jgi:hypothetical protein